VRIFWRQLRFSLTTLLGIRKRGFFIPYLYADTTAAMDYPALAPLFDAARQRFEAVLANIGRFSQELSAIDKDDGPARFNQDWFPRLDAAAAYAIVRAFKPRRIVEIGSGHSTRFMARAVADGALATDVICIDPAPRAALSGLAVTHIPVLLQQADASIWATIQSGDMLFVDSSHIAMPGTDVDRLFADILPRLPAGAIVHVHDIMLPYAYPETWSWRGYNEQIVVAALLQGGGYELLFASHYVSAHMLGEGALAILAQLPLGPGAHETSLWLRKR
jgi:predicted O-methyltransferase YrrM